MTPAPAVLAERLAAALARSGATTVFGLPGGGPNLELVGAAQRHGLGFVLAHAETSAAVMASTHGLLTGTPTPVVVTRGPGVASVVNGAAQATLDRYPLVVVTDTVPAADAVRVAHQRLDQRALLAPVVAAGATIGPATPDADLDALLSVAVRWPFGAVHLDVDATATPPSGVPSAVASEMPSEQTQDDAAWQAAADLLAAARRPVVVAGAEAAAQPGTARALEALGVPVLTTYQAVGLVPTEGPLHAGLFTGGALEAPVLAAADLVLAVGLDLVEPIPGRWSYPAPVVRLSAVPPVSTYLPVAVDLVVADLGAALLGLLGRSGRPAGGGGQAGQDSVAMREAARARLRQAATAPSAAGVGAPAGPGLDPLALVDGLVARRPDPLTVTVDAGAHFLAVMPFWPVAVPHRLLISNGLATMGFALPAAIGAALARPGEPVLALTGDGGLSMVLGELETLARLALPVTVVVFDDSALSPIEIKQREGHGGPDAVRYAGTDFAAVARGCGLEAVRVDSAAGLDAVLADPQGWRRPRVVDVRIDPGAYRHLLAVTRG